MTSIDMLLVVIAKNEHDMQNFNREHLTGLARLAEVVNYEKRSLSSIANSYLDDAKESVFGLVHADMEFREGALQAFWDCCMGHRTWLGRNFIEAYAVSGACGRVNYFQTPSDYVWSHQWGKPSEAQIADGWPPHPKGPCQVSTLDSSCIFFPTHLDFRFDETNFDSFHCHGEDICLQAQSRGIPVLVPSANAWHACQDTNGPNWGKERDVFYRRLKAKWNGMEFVTT